MNILHFNTLESTYSYVSEHAGTMAHGTVVCADYQTAGRGQRGNSWEAEAGSNLLATMLVKMEGFPVREQFLISEAVSVAIVESLCELTGVECSIKWPNDIYAGDGKLAGILISHSLQPADERGETAIGHTVIGFGINVNQTEFRSDAPNPVSLAGLTGKEFSVSGMLPVIAERILQMLEGLRDNGKRERLEKRYMDLLWRNDGKAHRFYDVQAGEAFSASIYAVEPLGHLVLKRACEEQLSRYAFKEVVWL